MFFLCSSMKFSEIVGEEDVDSCMDTQGRQELKIEDKIKNIANDKNKTAKN